MEWRSDREFPKKRTWMTQDLKVNPISNLRRGVFASYNHFYEEELESEEEEEEAEEEPTESAESENPYNYKFELQKHLESLLPGDVVWNLQMIQRYII